MTKVGGGRKYTSWQRPVPPRIRRRWLGRLIGVVLAPLLLLALLALVYQGLARSAFFQVTEIDIDGANRVSKEQIMELSGVDIHSNLLALSGRQIRDRVASHAWVATAVVKRHWPNRLQILVRERLPVAILNRAGSLFYLDRKGLPFAPVVVPDDLDFPVISGVEPEGEATNPAGLEEALQFLRYAGGGNPNLPAQNISEINIGAPDGLVLFLMSRPFPIRLGKGEMKSKYERLAQVLSAIYKRKEFAEIAYIDVDYRNGQILVGKTGG